MKIKKNTESLYLPVLRMEAKYNEIQVFKCTDAWAPIRISLHISGENESVHLKNWNSFSLTSRVTVLDEFRTSNFLVYSPVFV